MIYNQELMNVLSHIDSYNCLNVYHNIQELYHQLNKYTTIKQVNTYQIYLAKTLSPQLSVVWVDNSGIKSRIWRILGALYNNIEYTRRGQTSTTALQMPQIEERILTLQGYSWSDGFNIHSIYVGYDIETDTFYYK